MTPDKINAVSVIRRLLESVNRRQTQMDDIWRERRVVLEQTLELRVFEKALQKVGHFPLSSFAHFHALFFLNGVCPSFIFLLTSLSLPLPSFPFSSSSSLSCSPLPGAGVAEGQGRGDTELPQ